jgi:hypothetical protein
MAEQAAGLPLPRGEEVKKFSNGKSALYAIGAILLAVVLVLALVLGKSYLLYGLAGLFGLGVIWCLIFRPYWYFWCLFPGLLSWSYTEYLKQGTVPNTWMDTFSPWNLKLAHMPVADALVLLLFFRVLADKRFTNLRQWHPLDKGMGLFALAYPLAAVVGALLRNATTQTWTVWAIGVRVPVLLITTYILASRMISPHRQEAAGRFILAPLLGLTGACFGAAYRGLVLHQLMDRGGTPILLVSEANMLPALATLGMVLMTARRIRLPVRLTALVAVLVALAVLLTSTRRSILILGILSFVVMFFYLPPLTRVRFVKGILVAAVGGVLLVALFLHVSGKAGQLWTSFMTGAAQWTAEGVDYRTQEIHNVVANLNKYGGWFFGEGLGRRWERLLPQTNLYGGEGYGQDAGHVWIYGLHVPFLHNLLDQGAFGVTLMLAGLALIYKRGYAVLRAPLREENREGEIFNRALLAGLLAGLLVSLTRLFGFPNVGIFTGALLGATDALLLRYLPTPPGLEVIPLPSPSPGQPRRTSRPWYRRRRAPGQGNSLASPNVSTKSPE